MSVLSSNNTAWRKSLLQQLQARNRQATEPFESVIQTCVSLFEKIDSLQREKLNLTTTSNVNDNASTSSAALERTTSLQNDLKECQKSLLEKDSIITELNAKITNLMKEKTEIKSKNNDLLINLDAMKSKCQSFEEMIKDLKDQNTLLTDEHTALQIAYNSLNNKHENLESQYNELVARWITLKAKDAEIMNEENEKVMRIQHEKVKKQIEDVNKITVSPTIEMNSFPTSSKDNQQNKSFACIIPQKPFFHFDAHNEIYMLRFDIKTHRLTSGGGDRKVKIWDLSDMKANLVEVLSGSNASVTSIDIFEEYLVASSNDHASRVWTLNDFRLRRTLTGHSNKVMSVKFLGVNNKVVSGSYDKTLKIWDLNRNACMRTLFAGSSCIDLVNIDEHFVASSHFDKKIRFWDSRTDSMSTDIVLQGKVTSLEVSLDKHYLLCTVRNVNTLKCFDLRMNQVVRDYTAESFNVGCDWTRVKLSPDNQLVACGSNESNIFFWNFSTGKLENTLSSNLHNGTVVSVEWHPKGDLFASADRNKNIIIWH